jgi:hypothetical protein
MRVVAAPSAAAVTSGSDHGVSADQNRLPSGVYGYFALTSSE